MKYLLYISRVPQLHCSPEKLTLMIARIYRTGIYHFPTILLPTNFIWKGKRTTNHEISFKELYKTSKSFLQ